MLVGAACRPLSEPRGKLGVCPRPTSGCLSNALPSSNVRFGNSIVDTPRWIWRISIYFRVDHAIRRPLYDHEQQKRPVIRCYATARNNLADLQICCCLSGKNCTTSRKSIEIDHLVVSFDFSASLVQIRDRCSNKWIRQIQICTEW